MSAAYTKVKNAFKSIGAIRKKIHFDENYKKSTMCAILRENTCDFVGKGENLLYRNNNFGAMLIGFGDN